LQPFLKLGYELIFKDGADEKLQVVLLMLRTAIYLPPHTLDHTYITNHDKHDVSPTAATVSNNHKITTLKASFKRHIRKSMNAILIDARGNGRVSQAATPQTAITPSAGKAIVGAPTHTIQAVLSTPAAA
jgi:hypothetical protein